MHMARSGGDRNIGRRASRQVRLRRLTRDRARLAPGRRRAIAGAVGREAICAGGLGAPHVGNRHLGRSGGRKVHAFAFRVLHDTWNRMLMTDVTALQVALAADRRHETAGMEIRFFL